MCSPSHKLHIHYVVEHICLLLAVVECEVLNLFVEDVCSHGAISPLLNVRSFLCGIPEDLCNNWRSDETFAAQFIRGVNPLFIVRAAIKGSRALPHALTTPTDRWAANVELINAFLVATEKDAAVTLDSLTASGRLYFLDYEILSGIPVGVKGTVFYAPIVLLYHSKANDKLMPLAIQVPSTRRCSVCPAN